MNLSLRVKVVTSKMISVIGIGVCLCIAYASISDRSLTTAVIKVFPAAVIDGANPESNMVDKTVAILLSKDTIGCPYVYGYSQFLNSSKTLGEEEAIENVKKTECKIDNAGRKGVITGRTVTDGKAIACVHFDSPGCYWVAEDSLTLD